MTRILIWPVVLIVTACMMAGVIMANVESPLRAVFTLGFFLVCPGMAFVQLLRVSNWITELTLALALSTALTTLTSEVMIYTGAWSPQWAALGLITITLLGAFVQLALTWRASTLAYREKSQ
jgi:hypothetical protein